MMSSGLEGPIAPRHIQTSTLLVRPYTETEQAYEESVGLRIRGPNAGFNRVLLVSLKKGVELINSTLQRHNNSKHVTMFSNKVFFFKKTCFLCLNPSLQAFVRLTLR